VASMSIIDDMIITSAFNKGMENLVEARKRVEDDLWRIQLKIWADSRRVTVSEALSWINVAPTLAYALQYPAFVIYECGKKPDGSYAHRGIRYGIDGPDYISGLSINR
jgi:hypothetical protein